jgi:hypothetical protein
MPALQYGQSSYERGEGNIPALPVVNLYVEQTGSEGPVMQSRPGLADRSTDMGAGPIKALFKRDGVVSGNLLGVSAGKLYDVSTEKGTIAGTGPVSIAGNETGVLVTAGTTLYKYDGTTFGTVTFPDSANVIKVLSGAGRFIAIRGGTQQYYFTPSLAQTFDGADFISAESGADDLLDALFIDDQLVLFGAETVEFHPNTGSSTVPFAPLQGRVYERGIKATGCATALGSSFAWITDQNQVCIQDENNIVSNAGLEERIADSTTVSAFNFFIDGAEFLCIRMDDETQVYNLRTGTWSEFASYGQDNWIPQCHADGVFGSSIDGKTLAWGVDKLDLGGVLERRFRAGQPINGGGIVINRLGLRTNPGNTPYLTGDYTDPVVEVRISRDAGRTWGLWRPAGLGAQGAYRDTVEWRALGMASQPAFLCEFRFTDPAPFRVSGVFVNEPFGGR